MSSGASIAPPERLRSSAVVTTAPAVLTRSTRQHRSDVQAMPKSAPSTSKMAIAIPEEEGEEDGEGGEGDKDEENSEDEEDNENEEDNEDGEDNKGSGDEEDGDDEGEGEEDDEDEGSENEGGEDEAEEAEEGGENEKVGQGEEGGKGSDDENGRENLTLPLSTPTGSCDFADVETCQRGRSVTPKPALVADGDIRMQSPENTPPKLHGASRTSGGISRGQATGNFLNAADFSSANKNDYIGPVRGQINIYLSQDNPAQLSPESLVAYARLPYDYASKTPIAPVLEKVARRYSPVRRKYFV